MLLNKWNKLLIQTNNMDKSWTNYAKWKKSVTKDYCMICFLVSLPMYRYEIKLFLSLDKKIFAYKILSAHSGH